MPTEPVPSGARRAHWLALLFGLSPSARIVLPFALLFFLGIGERPADVPATWLAPVPALLALQVAVTMGARYWSDRYWCTPREIVHRSGLLRREERRIPIAQIQELAVQQSLLQRTLGLATLTIQTGSGPGIPEIRLEHLARPALEELRRELQRPAPEPTVAGDSQPDDDVLLQLTTRDLVSLGLIENRGFTALACAYAILGRIFDESAFFGLAGDTATWLADQTSGRLAAAPDWLEPVIELAIVVVGAALLLRIFSIAWNLYYRHGFTLRRSGPELRSQQGLGERHSDVVPVASIQMVRIDAGLLQRLAGCVAVRATTSGGTTARSDGLKRERTLAPLLREAALPALLSQIWERLALDDAVWQRLPARSRRRFASRLYLRAAAVLAGIVALAVALAGLLGGTAGGWSWLGELADGLHARLPGFVGLWLVLWLPLALAYGQAQQRFTAYSLGAHALRFRSGWLVRRTWIFPYASLHTLELAESPFDRRHRMRSLQLAGASGAQIRLPFLAENVASAIHERLRREARRGAEGVR